MSGGSVGASEGGEQGQEDEVRDDGEPSEKAQSKAGHGRLLPLSSRRDGHSPRRN